MRADGSRQQALAGSETGDDTPEWDIAEESILPGRGSLLPDLDQQAPSGIIVMHTAQQTKLGFTSAVDNIGDGPIHIRGTRSGSARIMRADQLIHHRNGTMSVVSRVGRLAYEPHPPHFHWHLEPYEAYELRRASDGTLVGRDRKSGFCLLDRWGHAAPRAGIVARPPRYRRRLRLGPAGSASGRRGIVGGLHRPLSGVLPRPGHRHHRRRAGALSPRPSRQPAGTDPRAALLERRSVRADQDLAGGSVHGSAHGDGRAPLPGVRSVPVRRTMRRFDVLVVGAGPAGSAAAIAPRARRCAGPARRSRPVPARQAVRRRDHGSRAPTRSL